MGALRRLLERLGRIADSPRALALLTATFLLAAGVSLFFAFRTETFALRISAGDLRGRRAQVARMFSSLAARRGVMIDLLPASGSEEALSRVERRELDAALVQGGLSAGPDVREVAPLILEPLHLLVRSDSGIHALADLRGRRVNLSPPGSGTRHLALDVLHLARMQPGRDFVETTYGYQELEELPASELPDAIFHVSALRSPVARTLVTDRGYRLAPLPFAPALALRDAAIYPGVIPAYTYGADPPVPEEDVPTVSTRMLLVAHREVPPEAVRRVLDAITSDEMAVITRLTREEQTDLFGQPELPLHAGTQEWLHRNDPLLTPELMEGLESFRSFAFSLVVAAFLLFRWWRKNRQHGLDQFMADVSRIDRQALDLERSPKLDLARLVSLRAELGEVKARALEAFSRGAIHSEELLSSFLVHVSDVRSHLNAMVLHERERLEKLARARGQQHSEELSGLWAEALAEENGDRELREK